MADVRRARSKSPLSAKCRHNALRRANRVDALERCAAVKQKITENGLLGSTARPDPLKPHLLELFLGQCVCLSGLPARAGLIQAPRLVVLTRAQEYVFKK
jgi:hypothetical protein